MHWRKEFKEWLDTPKLRKGVETLSRRLKNLLDDGKKLLSIREKRTAHFIRYFYPGIVTSEDKVMEIESRTAILKEYIDRKTQFPPNCFGFQFFDKEFIETEDNERLWGKEKNTSACFYKGRVMTLEDVAAEQSGSVLHKNMDFNKIQRVLVTEFGQAFPIDEADTVLQIIPRPPGKYKEGKWELQ